jgi:hypothetical protein
MLAFILRRIIQSVVVMLVVALVSFSLFRFVGDPIASMVGQETTLAEREALRERSGSTTRSWCSSPPSSAAPCRATSAFLPAAAAGDGADPVAPAGDAGTGADLGHLRLRLRRGLRRLHGAQPAAAGCRTRS